MYIQNRRNSGKIKGYSSLQLLNGLIALKPAIAYFAYTRRYMPLKKKPTAQAKSASAHIAFLPTLNKKETEE